MTARKTLEDPAAIASLAARFNTLAPDSPRKWGRMSPHQMICHVRDSYEAVIGERAISPGRHWLPQPVLRWFMLNTPWPRNMPTRPEVDQDVGGTRPMTFDRDRTSLLAALERFAAAPDAVRGFHPLAGPLSRGDWLRWGYLHADHHLRQFGC